MDHEILKMYCRKCDKYVQFKGVDEEIRQCPECKMMVFIVEVKE